MVYHSKLNEQNQPGNGAVIGAQPVDMTLEMDSTLNPWYSGPGTMTLFGEVERQLVITRGQIAITTASF